MSKLIVMYAGEISSWARCGQWRQ